MYVSTSLSPTEGQQHSRTMPRPVRRPKKVTKAIAVEPVSQPAVETRQDSIENELFDKEKQTPKQRALPARASRTPLSDDEFGFFEVRDVVPVMHKNTRQAPSTFLVRPDTDEESELSSLSTIPTPSSSPAPEPTQKTSKPRQPLKTVDLINLLPRAHDMRKKRKSLEVETSEGDESEDARVASKRTTRRPLKNSKTVHKKHPPKVVKRKLREPTPLLTDDEEDEGDVYDSLAISVEARRKLDKIRAQFEEVDEWNMEVETISSPFYSS